MTDSRAGHHRRSRCEILQDVITRFVQKVCFYLITARRYAFLRKKKKNKRKKLQVARLYHCSAAYRMPEFSSITAADVFAPQTIIHAGFLFACLLNSV